MSIATTAAGSPPSSMTALRAHRRGGPEQLVVETAPRPGHGLADLVVEVHVATITFAKLSGDESWTRDGLDRTPVVSSHESSGVAVARGAQSDGAACGIGTEVFGPVPFDRDGTAAEYVVAPLANILTKPAHLTDVQASARSSCRSSAPPAPR